MNKDDPRIHQAEEYHRIVEGEQPAPSGHAQGWAGWNANVETLVRYARHAADILEDEGCPHTAESLRNVLKPFADIE